MKEMYLSFYVEAGPFGQFLLELVLVEQKQLMTGAF